MLNIVTPYGDRYKVNEKGEIFYSKINPSGQWIFRGLRHVKRTSEFIPFSSITSQLLQEITLLYKNGKPQYTVEDLDHGTRRVWGNTAYHGVKSIYFD